LQIPLKEGIGGEREGDFRDNSRVDILVIYPFWKVNPAEGNGNTKHFTLKVTSRENKAKLKRTIVYKCREHFSHW
jgi:hypothetical protein